MNVVEARLYNQQQLVGIPKMVKGLKRKDLGLAIDTWSAVALIIVGGLLAISYMGFNMFG